jgi:hypothetical protein
MKRKNRSFEIFSLSFLDVVSCGFGAIIILLVLIKVYEPSIQNQISVDLSSKSEETKQQIATIRDKTKETTTAFRLLEAQLLAEKNSLEKLKLQLTNTKLQVSSAAADLTAGQVIKKQMESARQNLSEEMRRLQNKPQPANFSADSVIGGVPVDSEYIIFIIDTSGSMKKEAWPLVIKKMQEILAIYPQVKGLQVMNDMGDYMFSQYAGKWIRDTPARRKSIFKRLANWNAFSNSSPVEGITAAVNRFASSSKKISIYIFGDDFSRGSIQEVVDTVAKVNNSTRGGGRVRIHAVGFPVHLSQSGTESNAARFAALMRRLAEDNNGSFVGINSL